MSDAVERYQIDISSVRVPDELKGMSLPVEIVSTLGTTKQTLVTLGDEKPTTVTVEKPGRYWVRAELPSGLWIAEEGKVLTGAKDPATVMLDFGSEEKQLMQGIRSVASAGPKRFGVSEKGIGAAKSQDVSDLLDVWSFYPIGGWPLIGIGKSIQLEGGEFRNWIPRSGTDERPKDALMIRRLPSLELHQGLSATVTMAPTPPWFGQNRRNWRPFLVVAQVYPRSRALIVWPWLVAEQTLTLLPDLPPAADPERPPLLAQCYSGGTAGALFSFIRGGALDSARRASSTLIAQAETYLGEKEEDPVRACIAAYTLLKIGSPKRQDWVANLANWFPFLPDGAIVHGWNLLHAGKADEARDSFREALKRGVPMYTMGIRLLRDGLKFVAGLDPNDTQVQEDALRASRLASCANLDSELTCLRLDDRLSVQFE